MTIKHRIYAILLAVAIVPLLLFGVAATFMNSRPLVMWVILCLAIIAVIIITYFVSRAIESDLNSIVDRLKQQSKALKDKEDKLRQSAKIAGIGKMAAGIAHEINNPLTSILGYAQLTLASGKADEEMKSDLQNIEREAKRCCNIIESLLNFARPSPMEQQELDINNVIALTLGILQYSIQREKVEIVKYMEEGLPKIKADANQLQQVFMNMVINAANAMPAGGRLEISTRMAEKGLIAVKFKDTGRGIEEKNMDKIFDPFYTTSYEEGRKGTGLGLSVSYGIIKEHGGNIEVESKKGEGTTFTVYLPTVGEIK